MSNSRLSGTSSSAGGASAGGMSILTVVQIVFIILKLTKAGAIGTWSWAKVLIPLWIELGFVGLVLAILIIAVILKVIIKLCKK